MSLQRSSSKRYVKICTPHEAHTGIPTWGPVACIGLSPALHLSFFPGKKKNTCEGSCLCSA